jgi:signal transduction histidine kinase
MQRIPQVASAARHGLIQVLAGPAPAPAWSWRRSRSEDRAGYAALAAATVALCFINVTHVYRVSNAQQSPSQAQVALALVVVLPLPLAARYPMLAWRAGWLGLLLSPLLPAQWWGGWPWGPPQVLALLAVFCLAAVRQPRAALWWMWALTLIPWLVWLTVRIPDLNGPASATIVFAAAAVAVDSIGSRLRTQRALATQTARTEAEHDQRAVLEERTRIARELHDVVAHHLSLIAVQAETAPYRLGELSEQVHDEFGSLSEVAREALAEMRRLLGVLRQEQAEPRLAPQPRLADVPALVDAARRAGVTVSLSVPAELGPRGLVKVPAGVGVCAYRIVQESLSNASQHAPGAAVTVSLDHGSGAVKLRVTNGPGGTSVPPGDERGPGHGLVGMRERVALLGGSLSAGPTSAGGFTVSAVLPLGEPV